MYGKGVSYVWICLPTRQEIIKSEKKNYVRLNFLFHFYFFTHIHRHIHTYNIIYISSARGELKICGCVLLLLIHKPLCTSFCVKIEYDSVRQYFNKIIRPMRKKKYRKKLIYQKKACVAISFNMSRTHSM